jgi:hypothetical protein
MAVLWVHSFTLVSSLFAPRSFFWARLFGTDPPQCDATATRHSLAVTNDKSPLP